MISQNSTIIENKLKLVNGVLESLFDEQEIHLDVDSETHLKISPSDKSKINGMLKIRKNLLTKNSNESNKSEDKKLLNRIGNYYFNRSLICSITSEYGICINETWKTKRSTFSL